MTAIETISILAMLLASAVGQVPRVGRWAGGNAWLIFLAAGAVLLNGFSWYTLPLAALAGASSVSLTVYAIGRSRTNATGATQGWDLDDLADQFRRAPIVTALRGRLSFKHRGRMSAAAVKASMTPPTFVFVELATSAAAAVAVCALGWAGGYLARQLPGPYQVLAVVVGLIVLTAPGLRAPRRTTAL